MTAELLIILTRLNLAIAAAVLLVLLLRPMAARLFGARVRYGLWCIVPAAALASLIPAAQRVVRLAEPLPTAHSALPSATPPLWINALLAAWAVGACVSLALMAWRQRTFLRGAVSYGPAVVGLIRPRIHLPADFEKRFSVSERHLILAHERFHLSRQDARINGALALIQCALWINPAIHLGVWLARQDQEMACDEMVISRYPGDRKLYAEALLKTQIVKVALPLGCYWPSRASLPLERRIKMLRAPARTLGRRTVGSLAILLLAASGGYAAWANQPTRLVLLTSTLEDPSSLVTPPQRPSQPVARPAHRWVRRWTITSPDQEEPALEPATTAPALEDLADAESVASPPAAPDTQLSAITPIEPLRIAALTETLPAIVSPSFTLSQTLPPQKPAHTRSALPRTTVEHHTEVLNFGLTLNTVIIENGAFLPF